MKQEIVKVGNEVDMLRDVFHSPNFLQSLGIIFLEQRLLQLAKPHLEDPIEPSSFTSIPKNRSDNCINWHIDGPFPHFVIAAYPEPTQIFVPNEDIDFSEIPGFRACLLDKEKKIDFVDEMISEGKGKILTPNPGDVYVLKNHVLHRTNPRAIDDKHMVIRAWFGQPDMPVESNIFHQKFYEENFVKS